MYEVTVPAGGHHLLLSYFPARLAEGLVAAAAALALLLGAGAGALVLGRRHARVVLLPGPTAEEQR